MNHLRRILWLVGILLVSFTLTGDAQENPVSNLEVEVDNLNPYAGEPILYTIRFRQLDTGSPVSIREPRFDGFGQLSLITPPTVNRETINAVSYLSTTQTITLIPLRSGRLIIEPYQVSMALTSFSDPQVFLSDAIEITVRELPANAPEKFTNAVGQFTIATSASTTNLFTGEAFQLIVRIGGNGNLEQLLPPEPLLPPTWNYDLTALPVTYENSQFGIRQFVWTVVPDNNSRIVALPPIEFVYFNPQADAYEIRQTPAIPITLNIVNQPEIVLPSSPEVRTADPELLKIPLTSQPEIPDAAFWLLFITAPLIPLLLWLSNRRSPKSNQSNPIRHSSMNAIYQKLDAASKLDPGAGYAMVEQCILLYLHYKTGRSWNTAEFRRTGKVAHSIIWSRLMPCLDEAVNGKYAPLNLDDLTALIAQTRKIFVHLEKL